MTTRTYRPPTGRARSFSPPARAASEPRSVSPDQARRLWRDLCEAAGWDSAAPDGDPTRLTIALRAVGMVDFPLPAGDLRGLFAAAVLDQMRLYARASGADTRRRAAPLIAAGARMLRDLLIEQGAELAAQARGRMGQRDD